jgi:hypothetical protein
MPMFFDPLSLVSSEVVFACFDDDFTLSYPLIALIVILNKTALILSSYHLLWLHI